MNFSIQAIYNWYRNTIRNPKYRWWVILGSLLYLFSPIDIAPDFIPIVGLIDDGVVLTLLISEISQMLAARLKGRNDNEVATETGTVDDRTSVNYSEPVDVKAVPIK